VNKERNFPGKLFGVARLELHDGQIIFEADQGVLYGGGVFVLRRELDALSDGAYLAEAVARASPFMPCPSLCASLKSPLRRQSFILSTSERLLWRNPGTRSR